jgi:hypothetical protein
LKQQKENVVQEIYVTFLLLLVDQKVQVMHRSSLKGRAKNNIKLMASLNKTGISKGT